MLKEIDYIKEECIKETQELKRGYEQALDEYKEFQLQKAEFEQKGRVRKADTETDFKDEVSQIKTVSHHDHYGTGKPASSVPPITSMRPSDSGGDSDFERAEESEDILDTHINRVDRDKIQDLIKQVNDQEGEERKLEGSSGFDRDSDISEDFEEEPYSKVKPVKKQDIMSQASKILKFWEENDIDIMEVQNIIFDDFSLTHKISVINLTQLLIDKFDFNDDEAMVLARYMVEQPEKFKKANDDESEEVTYRFNPDAQLSHAKVVSRLQSVMSGIMANQ